MSLHKDLLMELLQMSWDWGKQARQAYRYSEDGAETFGICLDEVQDILYAHGAWDIQEKDLGVNPFNKLRTLCQQNLDKAKKDGFPCATKACPFYDREVEQHCGGVCGSPMFKYCARYTKGYKPVKE